MEEIELEPKDLDFIRGFDIVYCERWTRMARYIRTLRRPEQIWVYDFSRRLDQPGNDDLLPWLDYAFFSYDQDDDYIRDFLQKTVGKGCRCAIAMLGEAGSLAWDGRQFYALTADRLPVVNTVGAGDSYIAAFTYGLSLDEDIPACMARGKAQANRIIQQFNPYPDQ